MTKKKKILSGVLATCLVVSIAAGTTLSYFNDLAEKTNKFVVGDNVDIEIEEPSWPEIPPVVTPGLSMIKDPTATAVEGDSYMRMVVEIKDLAGLPITDVARVDLILSTIHNDTGYTYDKGTKIATTPNIVPGTHYAAADIAAYAGFNTVDFEADTVRNTKKVGVYYYNYKNTATNNVFKTTDPQNRVVLFTNVVIPKDWGKTEMDLIKGTNKSDDGKLGFQIIVSAQAIQSIGFADRETAFTALDVALPI